MKIDQETLIKQRFWFLLGLFVPLVFVCLILLWTSVAKAIGQKKTAVDTAEKDLNNLKDADAKNATWVDQLSGRETKAAAKRKEIWEKAWKSQADLITWPERLQAKLKPLYFGDNIDASTRDEYMKEDAYATQVDHIVDIVDPVKDDGKTGAVQYEGGWQKILKVVPKWTERPTPEDVWLAQEDLWVQAGLLEIIRDANDSVATFKSKDHDEIAALEKSLADKAKELEADQKQLKDPAVDTKLGADRAQEIRDRVAELTKQMKADSARLRPLQDRVKPDADKGEIDRQTFTNATWKLDLALVRDPKKSKLAFDASLTNISGRQQLLPVTFQVFLRGSDTPEKFDAEGVPLAAQATIHVPPHAVRALDPQGIDKVQQVFDWRTAPVKRIDRLEFGSGESSRTAGRNLKINPIFAPKKDESQDADASNDSSTSGDQQAEQMMARSKMGFMPKGGANAATDASASGLTRNRYIEVTPSVRRMPVALLLVVDQAHLQDVLTAVANSKLRIQTTQVEWQHFPRGASIKPPREEDDTTAPVTKEGRSQDGRLFGTFGTAGSTSSNEPTDDLSSNLVEVAIYGIASLYERYPPKDASETTSTEQK
ncbi:MAG TPA: hypothetical protein VG013_41500 [Gemmataceae bacterium]|nr:hypothetical protein [Gemmataceae bacterium]